MINTSTLIHMSYHSQQRNSQLLSVERPLQLCWNFLNLTLLFMFVLLIRPVMHTTRYTVTQLHGHFSCFCNCIRVFTDWLFVYICVQSLTLKKQSSVSSCSLFHQKDKPSAKISCISYLPCLQLSVLPLPPLLHSSYFPLSSPHSHLPRLPSFAKIRFAFLSEFLVSILMCYYN